PLGTLAKPETSQRVVRAPPPDLRRHLMQRRAGVRDPEEREQQRQRVLEAPVEREHLAGHLLAPVALVVVRLDAAVAADELRDRQVREGLAVRRASGVEDEGPLAGHGLQLVEEPRFADAGLAHHRDGAALARDRLREPTLHGGELRLAPDEARQAAGGAALERGMQPADAEELEEADRLGAPPHRLRTQAPAAAEGGGGSRPPPPAAR